MFRRKGLWAGLTYCLTFLLILSILGGTLLEAFRGQIDAVLGTQSEIFVTEDDGTLWSAFPPKDEFVIKDASGTITGYNTNAFLKAQIQLGRKQGYEGSVLLKNSGNALPLASGANVTLLGKRSHMPLLGEYVGAQAVGQYISLETAFGGTKTNFAQETVAQWGTDIPEFSKDIDNFEFQDLSLEGRSDGAGAGFNLNPSMIERYDELIQQKEFNCSTKANPSGYLPNEPGIDKISDVSLDGYKDAAIVVLGRPSSENNDWIKPEDPKSTEGPLALSAEEKEIVNYATDNFEKVIVIINTNSVMEIGELKNNDKVDAILWIGHPGCFGLLGVADLLCGRVSPSGGLADTYATINMSAPAMMNMGNYQFGNVTFTSIEGEGRDNQAWGGTAGTFSWPDGERLRYGTYVIEAEGIYVGYWYYETRYFDCVYNQGNAKSSAGVYASKNNTWNYADEVVYPFGYGLTYTDFDYELLGSPTIEQKEHEIYMTFRVKVTNKGDVASKANVQIYGQAPYIQGGLEKSAIQLLDFGKTQVLEPNTSETVTIEIDLQNLASYDMNYQNPDGTKGNYVLDEGNYYFAVGNGAHEALNNILAAQGKTTADGMTENGNAALTFMWDYDYAGEGTVDGTTFAYSKANVKIQNQIPYADWNYYEPGRVTYLSRSDWAGTYPVEYKDMPVPEATMRDDLDGKYYTAKTGDDTSSFIWGKDHGMNFYDLSLTEYDDPAWDKLLEQITLSDAITMAAYGGNTFASADSVGFAGGKLTENTGNGIEAYTPGTNNLLPDSCPWKVSEDDPNAGMSLKVFGSAPLAASSFSHELLYEMGEFIGQEAIVVGLPILWGPGANTHRHAYNGRNGEYYSEDPILTGMCTMEFAIGSRDNGLIASPKHYAFNDQETNRQGIAPFLTEQRARELELRAFQIAFEAVKYDRLRNEDTGMLGVMTSFSKVGAVECTSSYGLLKGILVGEWGFQGYAVTDIDDDFDLFDAVLNAGCTGYDNRSESNPSWENLSKGGGKINIYVQPDGNNVRPSEDHYRGDANLMQSLKDSVHRTMYTLCQSLLMNQYNSSSHMAWNMTWWRGVYIGAIIAFGALSVATAAMYVVSYVKTRKKET